MSDSNEDRALGRLEARMDGMEDRMQRLETTVAGQLNTLMGKVDNLATNVVALTTSIAARAAVNKFGAWLLGTLLAMVSAAFTAFVTLHGMIHGKG